MIYEEGQPKIASTLNSYTLKTLPKSLMLTGEKGCGKRHFADVLAKRLGLKQVEISSKLEPEMISEYLQSPVDTMYILNISEFTEKAQNQFLKFIEEPGEHVYIMVFAQSEVGILPTILNRCMKLTFEQYPVALLREKYSAVYPGLSDEFYDICNTPGQVELYAADPDAFNKAKDFCTKIVKNISKATYANTMSLSLNINYKDFYDKVDFDLFFRLMEYISFMEYHTDLNELYFNIYMITNKYNRDRLNKSVAKEAYVLSYLTALWKGTR